MNEFKIDIARDFTHHPFGRYRTDGDRSGEVFLTIIPPVARESRMSNRWNCADS